MASWPGLSPLDEAGDPLFGASAFFGVRHLLVGGLPGFMLVRLGGAGQTTPRPAGSSDGGEPSARWSWAFVSCLQGGTPRHVISGVHGTHHHDAVKRSAKGRQFLCEGHLRAGAFASARPMVRCARWTLPTLQRSTGPAAASLCRRGVAVVTSLGLGLVNPAFIAVRGNSRAGSAQYPAAGRTTPRALPRPASGTRAAPSRGRIGRVDGCVW